MKLILAVLTIAVLRADCPSVKSVAHWEKRKAALEQQLAKCAPDCPLPLRLQYADVVSAYNEALNAALRPKGRKK